MVTLENPETIISDRVIDIIKDEFDSTVLLGFDIHILKMFEVLLKELFCKRIFVVQKIFVILVGIIVILVR